MGRVELGHDELGDDTDEDQRGRRAQCRPGRSGRSGDRRGGPGRGGRVLGDHEEPRLGYRCGFTRAGRCSTAGRLVLFWPIVMLDSESGDEFGVRRALPPGIELTGALGGRTRDRGDDVALGGRGLRRGGLLRPGAPTSGGSMGLENFRSWRWKVWVGGHTFGQLVTRLVSNRRACTSCFCQPVHELCVSDAEASFNSPMKIRSPEEYLSSRSNVNRHEGRQGQFRPSYTGANILYASGIRAAPKGEDNLVHAPTFI